jgi:PST family polysaccharide transporter
MKLKILQEKYKNKDIRTISKNIFSLSLLNVINYIFPLIIIPFLTKVIGAKLFGVYSFSYSIIQYFVLIVNYGFQFSATKELAINRDNQNKINEIFSSVLIARIILSLLSIVILFIITIIIPKLYAEKTLILFGLGIIFGQALIPTWLFQGMEKMKYLTCISAVSKIIIAILIVLFVKSPNDYQLVNLFYSIGFITTGLISIYLSKRFFKIRFKFSSIQPIKNQFVKGWFLFISNLGMNLYREMNIIVLGFLVPFEYVGYFSAADKIIRVVKSFITPVAQSLFPFFGRKLHLKSLEFNSSFKKYKKIGIYYSITLLIIALLILFFSPILIKWFLGSEFNRTIINVQILTITIIFGGMNYYYGILGLVNLNKEKSFTFFVWISGIISIICCLILSNHYYEYGAAIATTIAEIFLFFMIIKKIP